MGSQTATTTGNNIVSLNTTEVAVNINKTVQQSEPLLIPGFQNETDVFLSQGLKTIFFLLGVVQSYCLSVFILWHEMGVAIEHTAFISRGRLCPQ
jgi:hypothetical protein